MAETFVGSFRFYIVYHGKCFVFVFIYRFAVVVSLFTVRRRLFSIFLLLFRRFFVLINSNEQLLIPGSEF